MRTIILALALMACASEPNYKLTCDSIKCGNMSAGTFRSKNTVVCEYNAVDFKGDYWNKLYLTFAKEPSGEQMCWELYSWSGSFGL